MNILMKIKALFHRNYIMKLKHVDVILTHQDADCAFIYNGTNYPPHIGSLIYNLEKLNMTWLVINGPSAQIHGRLHSFDALSFNFSLAVTRYLSALLKLVGVIKLSDYVKSIVWKFVLFRTKPILVIGIQPHPGLCIACMSSGIPVFDYQHGVINQSHWWYGIEAKKQPVNHLPSGFLCWDQDSAESLLPWTTLKGIEVVSVGNLWIDRFIKNEKHDVLVSRSKRLNLLDENKINILVSLQWGLNIVHYPSSDIWVMPSQLKIIIQETSIKYNWLLRLHPKQQNDVHVKKYLEANFGSLKNVMWEECSMIPLPNVLMETDAHITDMSTVVTESYLFGIKSAVMNTNIKPGGLLESIFLPERKSGFVELVGHDRKLIYDWLLSITKRNKVVTKSKNIQINSFLERFNV